MGGKIHSHHLINWNFNGTSYRELIVKDYKGFKIVIDEYEKIFDIHVIGKSLGSDFAFAINIPNKLFFFNTPTRFDGSSYKAYLAENDNVIDLLKNKDFLLFWESFCKMTNDLAFSNIEGVFFCTGEIHLALSFEQNIVPIIEYTIDLINSNPLIFYKVKDERIFKKSMPENLRALVPLLKKWSIPDDSEREQLMEETSEKQKKNLVKRVYPFMSEINRFLDSFGDEPLSHEAILLGNLAELVSELQIEMN